MVSKLSANKALIGERIMCNNPTFSNLENVGFSNRANPSCVVLLPQGLSNQGNGHPALCLPDNVLYLSGHSYP